MKNNTTYSGLEIAVVGMACKIPGADTVGEFWEMLKKGESSFQNLSNEKLAEAGIHEDAMNHPDYVPVGSFVKEKSNFDYKFFKYTPSEAQIMDPQIRLFHQCVWEALEDAAIDPETYKLPIGIYSGAGDNIMWRAQSMLAGSNSQDSFSSEQLSAHEFISTLISYKLGLSGPAVYVNTACSTSLVAIHVACRALLTGELKVALAGGIRIGSAPEQGYFYQEGMILSKDGMCRAYDKDANGTVGGEGGGVVVLKKLKDAIKDGDRIYGLVKSSAVNNDGNRKVGYTAPSVDGQSECIRMAHKIAGVKPDKIQFMEGHGTGTVLGDSIELKAIKNVFKESRDVPLLLGSLKSNIGHMDVGAGVGGFIKSILSVYYKEFPATLNFDKANVELDSSQNNMQVAAGHTALTSESNTPIRGGVSSFGIGGTNAHVIVEEYIVASQNQAADLKGPFLFQFSAKSSMSLKEYCRKMTSFIVSSDELSLQNIAFTLNRRRKNWSFRLSIVAGTKEELLQELKAFIEDGRGEKVNTATDLTGVVSAAPIHPEMGIELYNRIPFFQKEIDRLLDSVQQLINVDLKSYWLKGGLSTDSFDDQKCAYNYPLHFVLNYGMVNFLESLGVKSKHAFAHSLVEYVLASKSGIFSEKDAISLVHELGKLLDGIEKKPTLSITASIDTIQLFQFKSLDVVSNNSKNNCLVVIEANELDDLIQLLIEQNINYKIVNTGVPAHSRYLDTIKDAYRKILNGIELQEPISEYWNVSDEKSISSIEYWVNHMSEMVDLSGEIENRLQEKNPRFIEVGGQSLEAFIKDHASEKNGVKVFGTFHHTMEGKVEYTYLLDQLGQLWSSGINVICDSFHNENSRLISLPTYAWDKHQFNSVASINLTGGTILGTQNEIQILEDEEKIELEPLNAPTTSEEKILCEVFSRAFGSEINDVTTDFFELGGDSLKAMTCIDDLNNHYKFEITVNDFFDGGTIKGIAEIIEDIKAEEDDAEQLTVRDQNVEFNPLSYNQKNYFSELQFGEENIVLDIQIDNPNKELLTQAILMLCDRHEILRVNYSQVNGEWKQKIISTDEFSFPFEEVKLGSIFSKSLKGILEREGSEEFGRNASSLVRAKLVSLKKNERHFILTIHHSVADGFSVNIIKEELFENYKMIAENNEQSKKPLKHSYLDFVHGQSEFLNSKKGNQARSYWRKKIANSTFELFSDVPESSVRKGKMEIHRLNITGELWSKMEEYVKEEHITKQIFIQTSIFLYLRTILNRDDIVLFSTNSGRYSIGLNGIEVDKLIGFFVNLIPHVIRCDEELSGGELMRFVSHEFNEDLQNSAYPFEKMAEDNNWHDHPELLSKSALFNYHNYDQNTSREFDDDGMIQTLNITSKFLLNVICSEYKNGISIDFGIDQSMKDIVDPEKIKNGVRAITENLLENK